MASHIPPQFQILVTAVIALALPFYWIFHGAFHPLFIDDAALIAVVFAILCSKALLVSTMLVGVLLALNNEAPPVLRIVNVTLHAVLLPSLLYLLRKVGYEHKGFAAQTFFELGPVSSELLVRRAASDRFLESRRWISGPRDLRDLGSFAIRDTYVYDSAFRVLFNPRYALALAKKAYRATERRPSDGHH